MNNKPISMAAALRGASVLAIAAAASPTVSFAQAAGKDAVQVEEVVVTGTRVARAGFSAPTPTTVIGADTIAQRGQANVTDVLKDMPAFRPTIGPTTSGPALRGALATPDLRGLGSSRTLLLINGLRGVPTTTTGLSDLNLIPALAIQRLEVVTGGASAGYGSDAVAGVVNFILKSDIDGINGEASYGESRYGDNRELKLGLGAGTRFAGGRGRALLTVEYVDNDGVGDQYNRPWGRDSYGLYSNPCAGVSGAALPASAGCAGNVANGQPQRIILPQVYVNNFTRGGIITNASGVSAATLATLKTLAFGPGGAPYTFNFGSPFNSTQSVGAAVGSNPGVVTFAQNLVLSVPVERFSSYARADYDLTDHVRVYASGLLAGYKSAAVTFPQRNMGATAITIRADNAYLPAAVKALLTPTSTISVSRETADSLGQSVTFNRNRTYNGVVGLEGRLSGDWRWDAALQYGENHYHQRNRGQVIASRMSLASDAVFNGAGQIVCRSSLATPGNGCVPFNIFGEGSPSAEAQAYVRGEGRLDLTTRQTQAVANLRGSPFSTWAGEVSIAVGGEFRREEADQRVDDVGLNNGFLNGTTNLKPLSGSYTVKEGYAEAVVPLARDMALAKSLDLNGAVRVTDYSTSGTVTTWKIGAVYEPTDGLKFRSTRSRDIRAPNLSELYTIGQPSAPNTLLNPFQGNTSAGIVQVVTSGNLNLKPEVADTTTFGVVVQPRFAPGLSVSLDLFDIKVADAISTLANQVILNQCAAGNQAICGLITLSPTNQILQIRNQTINIASAKYRGVDFEAVYRFPLDRLLKDAPGQVSVSLLGTRAIDAITFDGVSTPVQQVGSLGGTLTPGVPKWTISHTVNYQADHWSIGLQGRYFSKGRYDNAYAEGVSGIPKPGGFTISDNTVPARYYVNLNGAVELLSGQNRKLELFGVINNLFNKAPPLEPQGGGSTNAALYDVIGQMFKVGVRFKY